jgi:hypothetical protein
MYPHWDFWFENKPSGNPVLGHPFFVQAVLPNFRLQGCQMIYFHTKNPNLGTFWRALEWKMLVYFLANWNNLRPFGTVYCH